MERLKDTTIYSGDFVGRQDEIRHFTDIFSRIRQSRRLESNFTEMYGSVGIGKSELAKRIARQCEDEGIAHAVINFKDLATQGINLNDPANLIREMAEQLIGPEKLNNDRLSMRINTLKESFPPRNLVGAYASLSRSDKLYCRPEWLDRMRVMAASFLGLVRSLGLTERPQDTLLTRDEKEPTWTNPVILIFDETDYAPIELINWIESWIINPLLGSKHCQMIWMSSIPWGWRDPSVRRVLSTQLLKPLTQAETEEQLELGISSKSEMSLSAQIFALTAGHPAANKIAKEYIAQKRLGTEMSQSLTVQDETEISRAIFEKLFEGQIFKHFSSEVAVACERAGLVRWFENSMLVSILSIPGDLGFLGWSLEDFGELKDRLKYTQLLVWQKGYALDPVLRPLIQNYYRLCKSEEYLEINRAAIDVHGMWLSQQVDNPNLYLIEVLYHGCLIEAVGEKVLVAGKVVSVEDQLRKRLRQYKDWIPDKVKRKQKLIALQNEILKDRDLMRLGVNDSLGKCIQDFLI